MHCNDPLSCFHVLNSKAQELANPKGWPLKPEVPLTFCHITHLLSGEATVGLGKDRENWEREIQPAFNGASGVLSSCSFRKISVMSSVSSLPQAQGSLPTGPRAGKWDG